MAPDASKPDGPPRAPSIPRPMGPLFPPSPSPPPPGSRGPSGNRRWHHEHPVLATLLALAALAVLLGAAFLLAPRTTAGLDVVYIHGHDPYRWTPPGTLVVIRNDVEYHNYLNVSVRPSLLAISASFGGVACEAAEQDTPGIQAKLGEARETARVALEESRRLVPPAALEPLHGRVQKVFEDTVATTDALATCIASQGASAQCPDAQAKASGLLGSVVALTGEVRRQVSL